MRECYEGARACPRQHSCRRVLAKKTRSSFGFIILSFACPSLSTRLRCTTRVRRFLAMNPPEQNPSASAAREDALASAEEIPATLAPSQMPVVVDQPAFSPGEAAPL